MPRYDYECIAEGKTFEVHQSFSDALLAVCPDCGGELHKLFRMPMLGKGCNITRKGGHDAAFSEKFEAKLQKDRPAYKSMRDQGLHPAKMTGAHKMMTEAQSVLEIETGRTFNGKHKEVESLLEQHKELSGGKSFLQPDLTPTSTA